MAINPNTTFSVGQTLTNAQMNRLPWGVMGYATSTSSHTQSSTAASDISGLTVTFTADSTRIYKTTIFIPYLTYSNQSTAILNLTDGSNTVKQKLAIAQEINFNAFVHLSFVETGLSGSTTRKARASNDTGTQIYNPSGGLGSGTMLIVVEDVGAA